MLEGGYGICIEGYNENSWHSVNGDAEAVEYQYVGCTVTLLPDMDALVFLNETDDGIENILIPVRYPMLSPDLILKKVMEDDYIGKTGADWDSAPEQTGTLLMRQS